MHPAYSVILFTTASGAGYGLLVWLSLLAVLDFVPTQRWLGVGGFGLALGLVTVGLLSSTAHLGRPERAWRAFAQWRTSWLSREGVMAVATYFPAGVTALGWSVNETLNGILAFAAVLTAACAVGTLFTTGMIYGSLRTIRQWRQPLTVPNYIVLGLASGAVLLDLVLRFLDMSRVHFAILAVAALIVAAAMKRAYWLRIDAEPPTFTAEAATGLGHLGKVRALEPPHTQPNFVMREMGYQVARRHARKLRLLTILLLFVAPLLAAIALLLLRMPDAVTVTLTALSVCSAALGVLTERWLFFAEAEHVVVVYYRGGVA
jgi:sulfite dehydrogenase (quinone) subunit SoeC